jgi:hypothetical protein
MNTWNATALVAEDRSHLLHPLYHPVKGDVGCKTTFAMTPRWEGARGPAPL